MSPTPQLVEGVGGQRWSVTLRGEGPVLLAVHGTGSSGHSFDPLAEHLAGYTWVVPDLPGHGHSTQDRREGPALPAFASGLGRVLDRLQLEPEVALGHSAGAAVLAQMALDGRLAPRLFVGLGAALVPFPPLQQSVASLSARMLARSGAGRVLARLAKRSAMAELLTPEDRIGPRQLAAYRRLAADPAHVEGVLAMLGRWDVAPLHKALDRVPGPWLLLAGEADRVVPAHHQRLAASRIPQARLAVLPGGHLLHEARPALVGAAIAEEIGRLHQCV